jgi:hypothetical protein
MRGLAKKLTRQEITLFFISPCNAFGAPITGYPTHGFTPHLSIFSASFSFQILPVLLKNVVRFLGIHID